MKKDINDFDNRFEFKKILFINNDASFLLNDGYKIVKSSYQPTGTFATIRQDRTNVQSALFCIQIMDADEGMTPDVFEMDLVKYALEDMRQGYGVVGYDKKKYMYVIKDIEDKSVHALYMCKIEKVIGNVSRDPEILQNPENVKPAIERDSWYAISKDFPGVASTRTSEESPVSQDAEFQYAALDEPVPGLEPDPPKVKESGKANVPDPVHIYVKISKRLDGSYYWHYRLENKKSSKSNSGPFNTLGLEEQYYFLGCVSIALGQLKHPKKIVLHTSIKGVIGIIDSLKNGSFDVENWKYKNGLIPQDATKNVLRDILETLAALNIPINAKFEEKAYIETLFENEVA